MFTAFSTALSGMAANAAAIDVISNNLANLNTTGYKASDAQFQDLMASEMGAGSGASQIGMGVAPVRVERSFTQGSIQSTGGATDAAIQGDGFFVVRDSNNQMLFTRAGNFKVDSDGNLVTISGDKVQGWSAVGGTVNPNGPIGNVTVPTNSAIPATPTTKMTLNLNLDASAQTGTTAATFGAPIQVVDSLGATHTLTATFTKTGANTWKYSVTIPQADLASTTTTPLATGTLTFDSTGKLTSPAASDPPVSVQITGLADSAADMTVNWSLFDNNGSGLLTQFAQASSLAGTDQDGAASGQITKIGMQDGGLIIATYSNGQQATVGQLALPRFAIRTLWRQSEATI